MTKIAVVGTGYVGLISGACLADLGHDVVCVDLDPLKIDLIRKKVPTIHEAGLRELLERNVGRGLTATTDLPEAVLASDLILIAVGTPFDGQMIDLSYVERCSEQIGRAIADKHDYCVVVVRSTVVPGTTGDVVLPILERASGKRAGPDFGVGMNPEFLRQGEAVADFMDPGRIVLGGIDGRTIAMLDEAYAGLAAGHVVRTDNKTAEMIKYASNALYANLISFSNEMGNICEGLGGLDVVEVMRGVHLDERLSPVLPSGERVRPSVLSYLAAGCGFGGSCFPKDVRAIIASAREAGVATPILEAVMSTNENQPGRLVRLLERRLPSLQGAEVAVLGVAFKPGTDDIRESPSLPVIRELRERGARVRAYDPVARWPDEGAQGDHGILVADGLAAAVEGADAVLIVTSWPEFAELPELLHGTDAPVVVDGRRMFEPSRFRHYEGIGFGVGAGT